VHVASPIGGRLDQLVVQRGQSVPAKAPLFPSRRSRKRQLSARPKSLIALRIAHT
jgi:hypothetical protein